MEILRKIFYFFLDIAQTLILAIVVFFVVYVFIARPYQVSGASMHPTFLDQEYVLTSIISKHIDSLQKGDVVVFEAPNQENTEFKKDFIKRVIGVAGDSVMVSNNNVYVNGKQLDESAYLKSDVKTYAGAYIKEGVPVTVPQDSYIVFGDNRSYSSDSREWGFVIQSQMIGKSIVVYLPVDKMRIVKNPFH